MTTPRRSRSARPAYTPSTPSVAPIGSVRRAQLITTYGVGSMIAVGEASYIVASLEEWEVNNRQQTFEPRLQRALRVSKLYLPPAADNRHGAALRRFPDFYSCRQCT